MDTDNTGNWRELFDVALFEPNRVKLRHRIERARHAIKNRLDVLIKDPNESGRTISERIALSDALITLAQLEEIVFCLKPSASVTREGRRVAS
jgi:hypothetical protein